MIRMVNVFPRLSSASSSSSKCEVSSPLAVRLSSSRLIFTNSCEMEKDSRYCDLRTHLTTPSKNLVQNDAVGEADDE